MSFGLQSFPTKFAPAYKPVLWSFKSTFSPNTNAGEVNIPIIEIRTATLADINAYGVGEGDVLMEFNPTPDVLYQYQTFSVTGTLNDFYSGTYRVRRVINSGLVVIDAEWNGDDTGGTWTKTYERYVLIAEVTFSGIAEPVRYEMSQVNGLFTMDLSDAAQRGFLDILSHVDCRPGTDYTTVAGGENYITQTYSIRLFHGYMVTGPNNEYYFAEVSKGIATNYGPAIVVNAVQPDNHVDIDGTVDLSWQANLTGYLMNPTMGGLGRKFLTYGPMDTQVMGTNDDAFLAFLWDERPTTPLELIATARTIDGTFIANASHPFGAPLNSGVIAIGPRNFGSFITSDTHEVSLRIITAGGTNVSRAMTYTIDRECGEAYIRPQALNPLGGIDSIGLNIRQRDGIDVERYVTSKPNMEVSTSPTWTGDYNRRTWAIEMDRTYGASSKPQTAEMRKFFGENIFASPDVRIPINETRWTPIIITTGELALYNSQKKPAPIRFDFVLGTDNMRQRR